MIFRRSLVREMTATAIGLFLVLLAILFTNLVLRLLARAAGGTVAPEGILALLGFNALFYFNILLSVTVFVTVLLTLTRWYRDSEMIVWFTSGQGLTACLRPILWFAAPFLAAILVLSLFLSPWAEQRRLEYERQLESRDEITLLTPGLFREFRRANVVVFVESINTFDGTIRNVFLHSVDEGKDSTTVARSGMLQVAPNGDRFIVLSEGRRYEGKPGTADYRVVEFGSLGRRIEPAELRALPASSKAIPTALLVALDGPVERAELFWRLSVPISAFVLTLLAVPLAYVNPRIGRSFNLIAAAFLYMLYSNCLNIVQSFIAQDKLAFLPGLVLPHIIAVGVVVLLFGYQLSLFGVFRRGFRTKAAAA
jgi:lipopolysaccharide export system permease protein